MMNKTFTPGFNLTVISEQIINPGNLLERSVELSIGYGTDEYFLTGCLGSMASVMMHNSTLVIHFYLIVNAQCELNSDQLHQFAAKQGCIITVIQVDEDPDSGLPTNKLWSQAIYYRFFLAEYLADSVKRILYLDADVVCAGNLAMFTTLDLGNNDAAAVHERSAEWWRQRAETLHCPAIEQGYYNTGVLFIDLEKWSSQQTNLKIAQLLTDKQMVKRLSFFDQDVFNVVLAGKILTLDSAYNCQFSLNRLLKDQQQNGFENATLIHYIGPTKPWFSWANYAECRPFWSAVEQSPWHRLNPMKPVSASQYRYAALHLKKQRKLLKSMAYFIVYLFKKVSNQTKKRGV